jgi:hypothetical protein
MPAAMAAASAADICSIVRTLPSPLKGAAFSG